MRPLNRFVALARGLMPVAVILATILSPSSGQARADQVTALVPAYFYPTWWVGSPWDDLNESAAKIPIEAIMNPASGPGTEKNPDYVFAVDALRAAGGKVIGYVPTGYGSRPIEDVIWDIIPYLIWYNVDGIFIDEMGNGDGNLDYKLLYRYIKILSLCVGRDLHVVGNPGIPFAQVEAYLEAADTLTIFEGPLMNENPNGASFANYPTEGPYAGLPQWFRNYPGNRFANLVFDVPSDVDMSVALDKAISNNADYVYLTNDQLPNPWDTLPPYWDREVDAIASINALQM